MSRGKGANYFSGFCDRPPHGTILAAPQRPLSQFLPSSYLGRVGKVSETWSGKPETLRVSPGLSATSPTHGGGFEPCQWPCASRETLGIGAMPTTHRCAGGDAWLVMQGQHRTDASGHNSDLPGQLKVLDSQVWGFPGCCSPGHRASLSELNLSHPCLGLVGVRGVPEQGWEGGARI